MVENHEVKQNKKTNEKYGEGREIGKHRHSANLGEHSEIIKWRERGKGKKPPPPKILKKSRSSRYAGNPSDSEKSLQQG